MNREETARNKHRSGNNCAVSVYSTFYDKVSGLAPMPRSEGGKCGAVLSAEKVLSQLGHSTEGFDQKFLELFGSLKCAELRKGKYPCNDLVGTAARMAEEMVEG
ncbi:MAG: hypothetical protein IJ608_15025 [Lachnospiraceae bacterium]|nr:hypothetical protein [Lachnospiraceae bacterium]